MNYLKRNKEFMASKEMNLNDPSEVYSIIKSPEIRDFFRHHVKLDIFQLGQIILYSYISMQQKISMLKQLSLHVTKQETILLNEMYSILEMCMRDIYNPSERTVFALEYVSPYFNNCSFDDDSDLWGFYDTVDELLCEIEKCSKNNEMTSYGNISLLQIPQHEKLKKPFEFRVFWVDGCWQVKDIMLKRWYQKYLISCGYSEDTIDQLNYYNTYSFERLPLPFEEGDRLKFQVPYMEEPFYGILECYREYDENGYCERHYYLWEENESKRPESWRNSRKRIDLGDIVLSDYGYSPLDWLERA